MSFNTFGHLFQATTFGESHDRDRCVVDGCPPLLPLTNKDIQPISTAVRTIALHHQRQERCGEIFPRWRIRDRRRSPPAR
jgi:chorismate synthase